VSSELATPSLLRGIPGSPGVAVGTVLVLGRDGQAFPRKLCALDHVEVEVERFRRAALEARRELSVIAARVGNVATAQSVLEAYGLMVQDPMLAAEVERRIREERRVAEWAVALAVELVASQLARASDPYLRERSRDVEFVGEHLLRAFSSGDSDHARPASGPVIVVARDLSPADTAGLFTAGVTGGAGAHAGLSAMLGAVGGPIVGLVTERGSRTSHTALTARALKLPAVVGVSELFEQLGHGDRVIVDGFRGVVTLDPDALSEEEALERAERYRAHTAELALARDRPTASADGVQIVVRSNVEVPEEAAEARAYGAEGVGLYRTEYLYVERAEPPSEEEQLAAFRSVVESMDGRPVVLRTFDIGGDKFVSTFKLPKELNPMLGLRAVRLALSRPELFAEQLRAMVRASAYGDVRIMVPMISRLDELRAVRAHLDRAIAEVRAAGHPTAEHIPLGIMIEVPSAALLADKLAREADFMSIGTNDLVQYTLAVDRASRNLAYLASPFDPSILLLIDSVLRAGRAHERPVGVCGAMASDPLGAVLLFGLGVRELSMESAAILEVREALGRVTWLEAREVAERALELSTADEVEILVAERFAPRLADLLDG
jgi:phosphoenolpyruvate-protein phosphotransferase (PTS system enzyme I)